MAFLEFYKKGQGSIGRLLALISSGLLVAWGGYALWVKLQGSESLVKVFSFEIPHVGLDINLALIIALVVVGAGWFGVVWFLNRPRSVDLLVETESEMRKVSWPSRQEAWNSSLVVVVTVMVMMGLLFFYDVVLNKILSFFFA
jgi:preprotein translocase subunit SecE